LQQKTPKPLPLNPFHEFVKTTLHYQIATISISTH
jgi:hypothetical protein